MESILIQLILIILQLALLLWIAAFVLHMLRLVRARGLDVPFVPTRRKFFVHIADALLIREGDSVYDLGCGDGRFLIYCAKKYPLATFHGIEKSIPLFLQMRFHYLLSGSPHNLTFQRADFYAIDLSRATRMYTYLFPKIMQ